MGELVKHCSGDRIKTNLSLINHLGVPLLLFPNQTVMRDVRDQNFEM